MLKSSFRVALAAVLGLTVCMTLSAAPASARMSGPGGDTFSIMCYALQTRVDALVKEYGADATSDARAFEILSELQQIGQTWISAGCRDVFGSIAHLNPPPRKHIKLPTSQQSTQVR